MALSHVGARSTIEALDEGSAEANQCILWYAYSRVETLEVHDWSFARRRLTLATHDDDPPSGVWGFRYQYPSDCLVFRKIRNPAGELSDPVPFEIEMDDTQDNKSIITNLDDAVGVYTFDQETTALYSAHFVKMLSYGLAANIAFSLTGKIKIKDKMQLEFEKLSLTAPAIDANEQMAPPPKDAPWIKGR